MKNIYICISALLVICYNAAAYASDLSADSALLSGITTNEVATAQWESEADEELMREAALRCAIRGDSSAIEMFSTTESVQDINRTRSLLVGFIVSSTAGAAIKSAAIDCLHNIGRSVPHGLSDEELSAIAGADLSLSAVIPFETSDLSCKPGPHNTFCVLYSASAVTVPAVSFSHHSVSGPYAAKFCPARTVQLSRENEIDHADYYRLFLYVRDNTGAALYPVLNTYSCRAHYPLHQSLKSPYNSKPIQRTEFTSRIPAFKISLRWQECPWSGLFSLNNKTLSIPALSKAVYHLNNSGGFK